MALNGLRTNVVITDSKGRIVGFNIYNTRHMIKVIENYMMIYNHDVNELNINLKIMPNKSSYYDRGNK